MDAPRRLAAIMFTDMVGYTALAQVDEASALAILDRHNRLLRPAFSRHRGREVKTIGDAFLVEFDSALDAVRCALEVQRLLHEYNASASEEWRIRIRIGIHLGDVVQSNGDVLGDAVNIASRIQPLALPEGICLTQQVYDQVQNKIDVGMAKLPPVSLKNVHVPMAVYRLVQPWEPPPGAAPVASTPARHELAVLPLANISPDPHDEYFADGLTEELIASLSEVPGLCVIARSSVVPYKANPKSIAQVGAELNVGSVLEGSVRKAGNKIRITLQLIDVGTQRHIWSSSYNRELDDVFAVQSDIAGRTAAALRLELAPKDRAEPKRPPTVSLAAYDLYLRGLVAASDFDRKGFDEASGYFERATKLDPAFADAFAAWANLYVIVAGDSFPMREVMPRARELAARALELDPQSSDAHASLANVIFQFDHDWARAEEEFRTAVSLNPSNVTALRFYGLMLMALGRFPEAVELFRRGVRLDPAGRLQTSLAWAQTQAGQLDAAMEILEAQRDADPGSLDMHSFLGILYLTAGRPADALREADHPVAGATDVERWDHALLNALVGRPAAAREVLAAADRGEDKSYTSDTHRAIMYAALGEGQRALDLLEKEYREGDRVLWLYYRGIWFNGIRNDPRFVTLLRQYGLPTEDPKTARSSGVAPAPGPRPT